MQLQFSELDAAFRLIKLTGSLDIIGTGEIETRFAGYCALNDTCVLVDLSGVDFTRLHWDSAPCPERQIACQPRRKDVHPQPHAGRFAYPRH